MFYAFIQSIYTAVMFNFIVNFSWRRVFFVTFILLHTCILLHEYILLRTSALELEIKLYILGRNKHHYIIETIIFFISQFIDGYVFYNF